MVKYNRLPPEPGFFQVSGEQAEIERPAASIIPASAHILNTLRIGDIERNRFIERLNAAHSTGHLTLAELDVRVSWVMTATTALQLSQVAADLPLPAAPAKQAEPGRHMRLATQATIGIGAFLACGIVTVIATWILVAIL